MKYYLFLIACLINCVPIISHAKPTPVDMYLTINRIYSINTVEQTYKVDGFLVAEWNESLNKNIISKLKPVYENNHINELEKLGVWIPKFEFVNIVSRRENENKRVMVNKNGHFSYHQRFLGTFMSEMDLRKFPFDTQTFDINIEPYIYNVSELVFSSKSSVTISQYNHQSMSEWDIVGTPTTEVSDTSYNNLGTNSSGVFSHLSVKMTFRRDPNFYLCRLILPLSLILISSCGAFWVEKFESRLATSFTMMLTVVAYTFYTSSLLPRLPYTTFIERMVILGYITIFITEVIFIYVEIQERKGRIMGKLIERCRWAFPLTFACLIGLLVIDNITPF